MNFRRIKRTDRFPGLPLKYNPNRGYIGRTEITTRNYLFTNPTETFIRTFLLRSPKKHYELSQKLTQYIRKRGLTFSKKNGKGKYQIFSVPVTDSIIPVNKTTFDHLQKSAQRLVLSLRWVLQSIYGSEKPEDSDFVKFLPHEIQKLFLKAIYTCPQYFSQLHHPIMKDYPFFEVVGLDLVLVGDHIHQTNELFENSTPQELPFKLLELNAGSPSGASNNINILEGLAEIDPNFLKSSIKVLPNDHFETLAHTFKSIGKSWTGIEKGIAVILPPGGQSGAAPEIHQLSIHSGLPYVDPSQLYVGSKGVLQLRTLNGDDPIVTSIYSRVNADAALYNPEKGIYMRDAETGEPLYLQDSFLRKPTKEGKYPYLLDEQRRPIPIESIYQIPNALELIHSRKLFLGGLNRILDNKLILATLTHYAPLFYKKRLAQLKLDSQVLSLDPPESLPSEPQSIQKIKTKEEDWVVKSPNLSGGEGIHILLTLSKKEKARVLRTISKKPREFAYQKLVKIARIPVAQKNKSGTIQLANLAADMRMWSFFGDGKTFSTPKLTHNALVRFAPEEKGPLSSIVNTSQGGGYASLIVVDNLKNQKSVSLRDYLKKVQVDTKTLKLPNQLFSLPHFVGAQLVQIHKILTHLEEALQLAQQKSAFVLPSWMIELLFSIKTQTLEVVSYIDPKIIEPISNAIEHLETRTYPNKIFNHLYRIQKQRIELTELLIYLEEYLNPEILELLGHFHLFKEHSLTSPLTQSVIESDKQTLLELQKLLKLNLEARDFKKLYAVIKKLILSTHSQSKIEKKLSSNSIAFIALQVKQYKDTIFQRLDKSKTRELANLFTPRKTLSSKSSPFTHQHYDALFPKIIDIKVNRLPSIATQWEIQNQKLLTDSLFISSEFKKARQSWKELLENNSKYLQVDGGFSSDKLEKVREKHFQQFPFLKRYQEIIDNGFHQQTSSQIDALLELLPIFPYAQYNWEQFKAEIGAKNILEKSLFSSVLVENKIAILCKDKVKSFGLGKGESVGECLAKKRSKHGLFSESELVLWLSREANPLIQAYTLGHELIHWFQIKSIMNDELNARIKGASAFASFLNDYGNFLGASTIAYEKIGSLTDSQTVHYGLSDLLGFQKKYDLIDELSRSCRKSLDLKRPILFKKTLEHYGGLLGWLINAHPSTQIKANREIIPCLENAKNIAFAKSLGLRISIDEVQAALPSATVYQVSTFRPLIHQAIQTPGGTEKAYQVIGNHQFYGVRTQLKVKDRPEPLNIGDSYNCIQQQQ